MSLSSWIWGASQVDEFIDKATSELLPVGTEDIALNLEIADQIRSKSVPPKDSMRALKRRLNHKNPNVQLLALSLTDTCIKNGGDHFLVEVASREFMDNLVSILKMPVLNLDVKNKILRLLQNWATAFEGKPALSYVGQVYRNLKSEGFSFPPQDLAAASSAMVDTQTAPEWIDSDVCLRCRTPFSFTNRKHHCRNCGQVFDQQCSSKSLALPHFGIAQEVRVCDSCYTKLMKGAAPNARGDDARRRTFSAPRHRSGRDLADAELQRAIQLSLEEVGSASASGHQHRPGYAPSYPDQWQTSEPPLVERATRPQSSSASAADDDENDPELRAAIEASLREANAPRPSAPVTVETPRAESQSFQFTRAQSYPTASNSSIPPVPNYDLQPLESDVILTFSQTIQEVEARGGRDISRFPAVNELYDKANGLRPKLALSLDDADRKEKTLTDMHEKLSQAVKLYDKLLTEQLSRPARRLQQQQQQQQGAGRYNTVDGSYGQWATPQPQSTPGLAYGAPTPAPISYGLPHASQSPPPISAALPSASTPYALQRQASYGQQYQPQPQPQSAQASVPMPYPPQQQQQQQQQQTQPYVSSPPAPPSLPPQTQQAPPIPSAAPPASYAQYPQQQQQQPQQQTQPSYALPTSPPAQQAYTLPSSPYFAQSAPPGLPQPQYTASPPGATLSRQNTLSYTSPAPPVQQYAPPAAYQPLSAPAPVAPVSAAPPHSQPQSQQQYPQFPSVPSGAPIYTPGPGFEQTERKEALLIDL